MVGLCNIPLPRKNFKFKTLISDIQKMHLNKSQWLEPLSFRFTFYQISCQLHINEGILKYLETFDILYFAVQLFKHMLNEWFKMQQITKRLDVNRALLRLVKLRFRSDTSSEFPIILCFNIIVSNQCGVIVIKCLAFLVREFWLRLRWRAVDTPSMAQLLWKPDWEERPLSHS